MRSENATYVLSSILFAYRGLVILLLVVILHDSKLNHANCVQLHFGNLPTYLERRKKSEYFTFLSTAGIEPELPAQLASELSMLCLNQVCRSYLALLTSRSLLTIRLDLT